MGILLLNEFYIFQIFILNILNSDVKKQKKNKRYKTTYGISFLFYASYSYILDISCCSSVKIPLLRLLSFNINMFACKGRDFPLKRFC